MMGYEVMRQVITIWNPDQIGWRILWGQTTIMEDSERILFIDHDDYPFFRLVRKVLDRKDKIYYGLSN
jgi:hypothetical protein